MAQPARRLTDAVDGCLAGHRILICDRDTKWTDGFHRIVQGAGVRIVLTSVKAPNANAYAERFVRSIRSLDRLILFGERRLLRALLLQLLYSVRSERQLIRPVTGASVRSGGCSPSR
jgi:putative transposase